VTVGAATGSTSALVTPAGNQREPSHQWLRSFVHHELPSQTCSLGSKVSAFGPGALDSMAAIYTVGLAQNRRSLAWRSSHLHANGWNTAAVRNCSPRPPRLPDQTNSSTIDPDAHHKFAGGVEDHNAEPGANRPEPGHRSLDDLRISATLYRASARPRVLIPITRPAWPETSLAILRRRSRMVAA